MTSDGRHRAARRAPQPRRRVAATLRDRLPMVAERTVAAIIAEVPSYAGALQRRRWAERSRTRCSMALGGFLQLASGTQACRPEHARSARRWRAPTRWAGGEARAAAAMDALLAAYRVGARVAWRELSDHRRCAAGWPPRRWPSSPSWSSPTSTSCRPPAWPGTPTSWPPPAGCAGAHLERLAQQLLAGAAGGRRCGAAAERADWPPPQTADRGAAAARRSLRARAGAAQPAHAAARRGPARRRARSRSWPLLLVPDCTAAGAGRLCCGCCTGTAAVVGPARPWHAGRRVVRAGRCGRSRSASADGGRRAGRHRAAPGRRWCCSADPDALADLRARGARAAGRAAAGHRASGWPRRCGRWLLHQGRRDDVAAELFVHPQTVRYRMGQLRELLRRPAGRPGRGPRPHHRAGRTPGAGRRLTPRRGARPGAARTSGPVRPRRRRAGSEGDEQPGGPP